MRYGVGGLLTCGDAICFNLNMGYGRGTNTYGEIRRIWMILFFARTKNINHIDIYGDSEVITDWKDDLCRLKVTTLEG